VACRCPAPESPGCRLPARSAVWQRPALPLEEVAVGDPLDDEPLVAEDADALVLVEERECDELPPSETEPWKEQPATRSSAGRSIRAGECLTVPTLETRCDRAPVFV
jgi:hypothetical protein